MQSELNLEQINVAILVSDSTDENIKIVKELADKVKSISVITNKIIKFKRIEEKLFEEKGIAIKLTSNKKKSLKQEKIILNMDLNQKQLEEYEINRNAIIINIKETINTLPKSFQGININNLEIKGENLYSISGFFNIHSYEAKLEENIKEILNKESIEIDYLIGQRGKIEEKIKMY